MTCRTCEAFRAAYTNAIAAAEGTPAGDPARLRVLEISRERYTHMMVEHGMPEPEPEPEYHDYPGDRAPRSRVVHGTRICPYCGREYEYIRRDQSYCGSRDCFRKRDSAAHQLPASVRRRLRQARLEEARYE